MRVTRAARCRICRWWLTMGWASPAAVVMSRTQAVWAGAASTTASSRSTCPSPRLTRKSPSSGDEGLFRGLPYYSTSMSGSKLRILAVRTRRPQLLEADSKTFGLLVDEVTGLEECRQQPPDVVLLDIPGRWGGEEFLVTSARSASSSRSPPAATAAVHPAR